LALAAVEPDAFDGAARQLLAEMAAVLAYGIDNLRTWLKHREAQAAIARLAYFDPLTELPNRTRLLERLETAIQSARQQQHAMALLNPESSIYDGLYKIFGYRASDPLLKELAQRVECTTKDSETLACVGDTGFALLLPRAGADYAIQVAQQLRNCLYDPVAISGRGWMGGRVLVLRCFPDTVPTRRRCCGVPRR
jgi:diguanylate cyclase